MIGVFLALLELIREKKILVNQGEELSDVEIETAPPLASVESTETQPSDAKAANTEEDQ